MKTKFHYVIIKIIISLFILSYHNLNAVPDSFSQNVYTDTVSSMTRLIPLKNGDLFCLALETNLYFTSTSSQSQQYTLSSTIPLTINYYTTDGSSFPYYISSLNETLVACTRFGNELYILSYFTDNYEGVSITTGSFAPMATFQRNCGFSEFINGNLIISYVTQDYKGAITEYNPKLHQLVNGVTIETTQMQDYSTFNCKYWKRINKILCTQNDMWADKKTFLSIINTEDFSIYNDSTEMFPMSLEFSDLSYIISCLFEAPNDSTLILICFGNNNKHSIYFFTSVSDDANGIVFSSIETKEGGKSFYNYLKINDDYFMICSTVSTILYLYIYNVAMKKTINTIKLEDFSSSYASINKAYNSNTRFILFNSILNQYINIYEFDMLICSNAPLYILDYQENEVDFRFLYSNEEEYSDILVSFENVDEIADESKIIFRGVNSANSQSESLTSSIDISYSSLRYQYIGLGPFRTQFVLRRKFENLIIPSVICEMKIEFSCYNTCYTCSGVGNATDNQCIKCLNGFYFREGTTNCYDKAPSLTFYNSNEQMFMNCFNLCSSCSAKGNEVDNNCEACISGYEMKSRYTQREEDIGNCVKYCDPDLSVWYIDLMANEFICLHGKRKCPSSYPYLNIVTGECRTECLEGNAEECAISISTEIHEIITEIESNILFFFNNNITSITGENYIAYFYDMDTLLSSELSPVPRVLPNSCVDHYRFKYSSVISLQTIYPTNQTEYAFFDEEGNLLNLSICKNNFSVVTSLEPSPLYNLSLAKRMGTVNIDIFSTEDRFFNDYCLGYNNSDNDINLGDRRADFYQNVSLCDGDCEYISVNLTEMTVICSCAPKKSVSSSFIFRDIQKSFTQAIQTSNIKVAKCYKTVFTTDIFKNVGFIIMITLFLLQIANGTFMIIMKNKFGFLISKASPPIKIKKERGSDSPRKINKIVFYQNNNIITTSRNTKEVLTSSQSKLISPKLNQRDKILIKEKYAPEPHSAINDKLDDNFTSTIKFEFIGYSSIITISKNINWLDYTTIIKAKHPIISTFFSPMPKLMRCLRIALFLSSISISLALNALFYNDKYISTNYKNKSFYNFLSELPKIIYALFFGFLLNIFFKILIAISPIKKGKNESNGKIKKALRHFLVCVKTKIIIFFTFIFIFDLFFVYFVSAFCTVYKKSVKNWCISAAITVSFALVLPFILSVIIFAFRNLSFRYKSRCLFSMSEVLSFM